MQTDPRIIRTRKSVVDALLALMSEREIEKITVKDITQKADVNRATFYHHFKDKQALLQYTLEEHLIRYCVEPFNEIDTFSRELILGVLEAIIELHDYLEGHCQLNFHKFLLDIEQEIKSTLIARFFPIVKQGLNHPSDDYALLETYKLVGGLYSSAVAIRKVNHQRSQLINYTADQLIK
ncbi:TetR/AcrR family transcriptional regulator [Halolactibacillus sp. JCM 19043]|uniref:TetR/AcrR family transcriptional regulator n=1 Tax=Halolactibacillus sp. JCM 19043 TaxID=1460638 RepID=UPI00078121A5|nr:TetR/AcrR family transcriptional regulator [Halolactibacillus sp. JCM 19043]